MNKVLGYFLLIVGILLIYAIVTGTLAYLFIVPNIGKSEWVMVLIPVVVAPSYLLSVIFDRWFKEKYIVTKETYTI